MQFWLMKVRLAALALLHSRLHITLGAVGLGKTIQSIGTSSFGKRRVSATDQFLSQPSLH
jgi:hypothetical protein